MTKRYILTDLDNTLLDFAPHFEEWAESQGYKITRGVINQTYDFQDAFEEDVSDVGALLRPFFLCDHTMSNFPALADTVEPIQRLREQGFEFVGITACEPIAGLSRLRHQNLKNLFGFDFEEVFVTGYELPKATVLKNYGPSYWVEDNLKHAVEGAVLGHEVFLIDQCYNQCVEGPFKRVKNWLEIEAAINAGG